MNEKAMLDQVISCETFGQEEHLRVLVLFSLKSETRIR